MQSVFQLLLFLTIVGTMLISGYYSFIFLNKKIKESKTGWEITWYSVLLFLINLLLFFGGLLLLIRVYAFLVNVE